MYKFQSESALYSLPECQGTPCLNQAPKWLWVRIPLQLHIYVITISNKVLKKEKLSQSLEPILWSSILIQNDVKTRQNDTNYFNKKYVPIVSISPWI